MLPRAVTARVAYVPGTAFFADGFGSGAMRLSFCYPTPERIREGVRRLAGVIEAELELRATFDALRAAGRAELGPYEGYDGPEQRPATLTCATSTYPPIILAAKTGFRLLGQKIRITGARARAPRRAACCSPVNHIGYVDFVYGGLAANPSGRKVRFMAKRELFDHRWTGPLMRSMHHIEVDRADGEASLRHRGRPPAGRRGGRHLPRGHHLPGLGAQGVQDRRGPDRREASASRSSR